MANLTENQINRFKIFYDVSTVSSFDRQWNPWFQQHGTSVSIVDVRPYLPHFVGVRDRPRLGIGGFCGRDRPELPLEAHHLSVQPSVPWGISARG